MTWTTPGKNAPYRPQSHVASTVADILSRSAASAEPPRRITKVVYVTDLIDPDYCTEAADLLEEFLDADEIVEDLSLSGLITITGTAVQEF